MVEPMAILKIDGDTLIADGEMIALNPYGYGDWVVMQCVKATQPMVFRRWATSADLSSILNNPKFTTMAIPFALYPMYSSKDSIFFFKAGESQYIYLIAPKYTGHKPLTYTVGGKGVPRR